MRLHGTMELTKNGHLSIGGINAIDLAKEYGTPLLVMDEEEIRNRCQEYRTAFQGTGIESETIYASKAFLNPALCRILEEEGLGIDVVSGGELYIAQTADFPMDKIYFHGNNKTPEEISMALEANIGRFIIDNMYELELINQLAQKQGQEVEVQFRVKPGIKAQTHKYIQTGQVDSKFGIGIDSGRAMEVIRKAVHLSAIKVKGLHCHIGSQIFHLESFAKEAEILMDFCYQLRKELGITIEELNLGGGIGIPYTDKHPSISLKKKGDELNFPLPKIINEPGRYIVGTAGTTLYTIGSIKDIPDVRTYVAIDGGMTDNIRPALYNAEYDAMIANKGLKESDKEVTITGRCCETGDMLIHNLMVPGSIEPGDILAVSSTGAYTYSMASNYNGVLRMGIVLVRDGSAEIISRREEYQDLVRLAQIPQYLKK